MESRQFHSQTNVFIDEALVLVINEESYLAECFEVVFVFYANHGIRLDHRDDLTASEKCFISGGDKDIFPTNRLPSRNNDNSVVVSRTGSPSPLDHRHANFPFSRRFA